jgi:hypothetical protein
MTKIFIIIKKAYQGEVANMRKCPVKEKNFNSFVLLKIAMILFVFLCGLSACGPGPDKKNIQAEEIPANTLSEEEAADGWSLLFDGKSFEGWRGLGRESIPQGSWTVEQGAIKKIPSGEVPLQEDGQPLAGGDILTEKTFTDFELRFEWKISLGGNSGLKYNVSEDMSTAYPPISAALGFEYQILDDDNHPDAKNGANRTAAALYDLLPPEGKTLNPVGEWNTGRIVFVGNHGEHWLNGVKVLEYDLGPPEMEARLEASKYRIYEDFGQKRRGHIVIQDHTDAAWYRNIKIKEF